MTNTTSRVVETEVLSVRREAIAPYITITWNPDNSGHIDFWVSHEISENGVFKRIEPDQRVSMYPLRVTIADILQRSFTVPNPSDPENPITVPCTLLMGAIKQAFDDIYSERVNAQDEIEEAIRLEEEASKLPADPIVESEQTG